MRRLSLSYIETKPYSISEVVRNSVAANSETDETDETDDLGGTSSTRQCSTEPQLLLRAIRFPLTI